MAKEAKKVVKEGLSEYFMFTIEGTEDVANGWSKRMQALEAESMPFEILYRMRTYQYGPRPVRFFVWRNDKQHTLGESPLPDGRVRLFRENSRGGLSYLGDQLLRYVPIKAPIEVNLGPDDLVVYASRKARTERFNFSFHRERVNGWDERQSWMDTIQNYRTKPIVFELRRRWKGDVEYSAEGPAALADFQTIEARFTLTPRSRHRYPATIVRHNGANQSQSRILLR